MNIWVIIQRWSSLRRWVSFDSFARLHPGSLLRLPLFIHIYTTQPTIFFRHFIFTSWGMSKGSAPSVANQELNFARTLSRIFIWVGGCWNLPVLEISAALLNPLLHSAIRMTIAGMRTEVYAQNGMAHLQEMFKEYYEWIVDIEVDVSYSASMPMRRNN